ncbi:MAG: glycosyltransferase [Deltaproteobacteria bacterium]|nr:glycosyltransferase [Deltaproteobacteria bacterium]MBI4796849.1 glycosyltransferase [Deltaproteobacteria bacterium]
MKILYFSYSNLDTPNANQAITLGLLRGFAANGCQVDAVVPRPSLYRPEIPFTRFHFLNPYRGGRRYLLREVPYSTFVLWSLCRRYKYDAIYARDMDVFIGPRLCSRFFHIPFYLQIDDTPVEGAYPPFIRKVVELNLKLDYRQAAGLIVPSVPRCRWINRQYGVSMQKIHLVIFGTEELPPGVPTRAAAKKGLGLPAAAFCLGYLGSIYERYDFTTMLEAMVKCSAAIPDLYFIIVGGGSGVERVKQQARALGIAPRVIFTGFLQPEEFPQVLPAMDVGLMPLTKAAVLEHGPIHTKTATYASFALPVVAAGYSFDLDEFPEEVRQGVWLAPPEDAAALAAIILRLYRHPGEGERKARSLRRYVRQRLTWPAVAADILAIMEKSWIPHPAG